jgi:Flp pilus assembly pilin Flp
LFKLKNIWKEESGAASVEFAFVILPFLYVVFAIMEVSYKGIIQAELDDKLYAVAMDLSVNNHSADSVNEFMSEHFCPNIGTTFLKCEDVVLGVKVIPDATRLVSYRNASVSGDWALGAENSTLLVELNYPLTNLLNPIVIADIIERDSGSFYRSRGVVRREPLLSTSGGT